MQVRAGQGGDAGTVIAAVLQPPQSFHEDRLCFLVTNVAFLSRCAVYYSPRIQPPHTPDIYPLSPEVPAFVSLLSGLDAENILLDGLLQPARRVVQACRHMSGAVTARIAELQGQLVVEEARRQQNRLLRALATPGYWLRSGLRLALKGGKRLIEMLRGRDGEEIRKRHEFESDRLREVTDRLFDRWRSRLPSEACAGGGSSLNSVAVRVPALVAVGLLRPPQTASGLPCSASARYDGVGILCTPTARCPCLRPLSFSAAKTLSGLADPRKLDITSLQAATITPSECDFTSR
jgi:hypothetical protein